MNQDNLSSQIAGSGRKITLTNGNEITIKYGMSALVEIEKKHGSVNALVKILENPETSSVFSTLGHALWAGTSRKMPFEAFLDLLDPKRLQEYSEAFGEAFQEAMGTGEEGESLGEAPAA